MQSYMSTDQMINYLKTQKKIIVDDEDRHWLDEVKYVNLINPYKELFSNGTNNEGKQLFKYPVNLKEYIKVFEIENEFSHKIYKDIRNFERKFKNIIFDEICKEYVDKYNDIFCTLYIEEIENMLYGATTPPIFCTNINKVLTKYGYKDSSYFIEKRKDILKKLYLYGSSATYNQKSNLLIRHYSNKYNHLPLWILSSILTLGETIILYSMLSTKIQNNIYKKMHCGDFINKNGKIEYKKMMSFFSKLEYLRAIRNMISHFEALLPYISKSVVKSTQLKTSTFVETLKLINPNFQISDKTSSNILISDLKINFKITTNNAVKIKIIELMHQYK